VREFFHCSYVVFAFNVFRHCSVKKLSQKLFWSKLIHKINAIKMRILTKKSVILCKQFIISLVFAQTSILQYANFSAENCDHIICPRTVACASRHYRRSGTRRRTSSSCRSTPTPRPPDAASNSGLRAILNFTPGPQGWTWPLGWNLSPRGNVHPFTPPQGWTLSTV
jgi:hypothetical protein